MKVRTALFAASAVILVLAPLQASAHSNCLQPDFIQNWNLAGDNVLLVRQGQNDWYKLTLLGVCYGLDRTVHVAIQSRYHTMCVSVGDRILVHYAGQPGDCMITKIEPYAGPNADNGAANNAALPPPQGTNTPH